MIANSLPELRDLLLNLLDATDDARISETWPDHSMTLDDIAGQIVDTAAHLMAQQQRDQPDVVFERVREKHGYDVNVDSIWTAVNETANLINPERTP
jgi:hypothetical protein